MSSTSTALIAQSEVSLTLSWIDDLLARDSQVARAAFDDDDFSAELLKVRAMAERRQFAEAKCILDAILATFAVLQAIAFKNRTGKS